MGCWWGPHDCGIEGERGGGGGWRERGEEEGKGEREGLRVEKEGRTREEEGRVEGGERREDEGRKREGLRVEKEG